MGSHLLHIFKILKYYNSIKTLGKCLSGGIGKDVVGWLTEWLGWGATG
jgi:hypothetical protein